MLLWVYIAVYVLLFGGMLVAEEFVVPPQERDPVWERVADLVMLVVGLAGMVLYARNMQTALAIGAWKVVAPALVFGHGVMFVRYARSRERLSEEAASSMTRTEFLLVEALTTVVLAPSLLINLHYAFFSVAS